MITSDKKRKLPSEADRVWKRFLAYKREYKKRFPLLSEVRPDLLKELAWIEVKQEKRIRHRWLKKKFLEVFGRKKGGEYQ